MEELHFVSLPISYEIDNSFKSSKYLRLRLRICHEGKNFNNSFFTVEDLDKEKESLYNSPILANVIFDENGQPQFGGHDMSYEPDKVKEGEYRIIYKEIPIGVIPESCNYAIEDFNGKKYVCADAYAYRGYSNYAQDILERDEEQKISMEIEVEKATYDGKQKIYNITDFKYLGVTFLNKNFETGMENARATVSSFSKDEFKDEYINLISEVKDEIAQFESNRTVQKKEGAEELENDEKFIKKFEISHEDIRYSLYKLLEITESEDKEWYFIDCVYDNKFEYENWDGNKIYRQTYSIDGDTVAFSGDRIQLWQERLTEEEKAALDNMRANYQALQDNLNSTKNEFESIKSEFDTYKNTYKTIESDVEDLRTFKNKKLEEERSAAEKSLFEMFDEKLKNNKEYEDLRAHCRDYELNTLSDKCFSIFGKLSANFSKKLTYVAAEIPNQKEDPCGFSEIYEKYGSKNTK